MSEVQDQENDQVPEPPSPPEFERKIRFYPYQWVGIPLLLLIPILAILGVFAETMATLTASQAGIELEVEYPTRTFYQSEHEIVVRVQNSGEDSVDDLVVTLDKQYLDGFSELSFVPANVVIANDIYWIELGEIPPGESRVVTIDTVSNRYGSHQGMVSAIVEGYGPSVSVETFIVP